MESSGTLWGALGGSAELWEALESSGRILRALGGTGGLWEAQKCSYVPYKGLPSQQVGPPRVLGSRTGDLVFTIPMPDGIGCGTWAIARLQTPQGCRTIPKHTTFQVDVLEIGCSYTGKRLATHTHTPFHVYVVLCVGITLGFRV